jgi:hypothetical protein
MAFSNLFPALSIEISIKDKAETFFWMPYFCLRYRVNNESVIATVYNNLVFVIRRSFFLKYMPDRNDLFCYPAKGIVIIISLYQQKIV